MKLAAQNGCSNPSVMYELGYARKVHGEKRIVALVNKAFGRVEDLPFDIRSARVSTYTRHRTKADGDTEPKQLADLLYKSLKAVLDEPIPEKELPETNPADLLTRLLPKSDGDIEVELLIKKHADALVTQMSDEERFPLANSIASDIPARNRYLADQANLHIEASLPLCELLGMGVAFGGSRHDHIWRRTVEDIGNVASQPRTGVDMSLLDLLYLPMLMLAYSTLIAGLDRDRYTAIRAALIDARIRNDENQKVPVISCADPWTPFRRADLVSNIALIDAESDEKCDIDRIGRLLNRTEGRRFRPGSLLLHLILREALRPMIPDDRDYTETFDKAEVLLALLTADAEDNTDQYIPSPYYGAFTLSFRGTQQARFEESFINDALNSGGRAAVIVRWTLRWRHGPFSICRCNRPPWSERGTRRTQLVRNHPRVGRRVDGELHAPLRFCAARRRCGTRLETCHGARPRVRRGRRVVVFQICEVHQPKGPRSTR